MKQQTSTKQVCPVSWDRSVKYTNCFSTKRYDPECPEAQLAGKKIPTVSLPSIKSSHPNECTGHDTKQSDGEVPVMPEIWRMQRTPSLPSLPGPL